EPEPGEQRAPPFLSSQGDAVAWLENIPGSGPPVLSRVIVLPIGGGTTRQTIDLGRFGPGTYMPLELDTKNHRVTLSREGRLLVGGFDGSGGEVPTPFSDLSVNGMTMRRTADGWLAWDGYRETGAYRVLWSLAQGTRTHTLPRGREISSVA